MKRKITAYEYWPYKLFYAPFVPYWLWRSVSAGSLSYFCRVNPGIEFGGFLDYSKSKILCQLPEEFKTKFIFLKHKDDLKTLPEFPFIVKPDFGERGVNVELINNKSDWHNYALTENLIVQEFVQLPLEFGIFYARYQGKAAILSITGKEFLRFRADGKSSIKDFVLSHPRAADRLAYLSKKFRDEWEFIQPEGREILLEPIGNHNRGTRFFDASDLITDELLRAVQRVANNITGFNYGRMDIKAASMEELKIGKFIILEINGANSEPTHIYDEKFSLWRAYGEVKRHLDIQYKISKSCPRTYSTIDFYKAIIKRLF